MLKQLRCQTEANDILQMHNNKNNMPAVCEFLQECENDSVLRNPLIHYIKRSAKIIHSPLQSLCICVFSCVYADECRGQRSTSVTSPIILHFILIIFFIAHILVSPPLTPLRFFPTHVTIFFLSKKTKHQELKIKNKTKTIRQKKYQNET